MKKTSVFLILMLLLCLCGCAEEEDEAGYLFSVEEGYTLETGDHEHHAYTVSSIEGAEPVYGLLIDRAAYRDIAKRSALFFVSQEPFTLELAHEITVSKTSALPEGSFRSETLTFDGGAAYEAGGKTWYTMEIPLKTARGDNWPLTLYLHCQTTDEDVFSRTAPYEKTDYTLENAFLRVMAGE